MCGACGVAVRPDPVLGPQRSTRAHLLVAATINAVCQARPGAPRVTVAANGWLVSGPSGGARLCPTIDDVWEAVASSLADPSALAALLDQVEYGAEEHAGERVEGRTDPSTEQGPDEGDLQTRTLRAGRRHAAHRHAPGCVH